MLPHGLNRIHRPLLFLLSLNFKPKRKKCLNLEPDPVIILASATPALLTSLKRLLNISTAQCSAATAAKRSTRKSTATWSTRGRSGGKRRLSTSTPASVRGDHSSLTGGGERGDLFVTSKLAHPAAPPHINISHRRTWDADKVDDIQLMLAQNRLFRRHARGAFEALVQGVSRHRRSHTMQGAVLGACCDSGIAFGGLGYRFAAEQRAERSGQQRLDSKNGAVI